MYSEPIARKKHRKERRLVVEHAPGTPEKKQSVRAAGGGPKKSLSRGNSGPSGRKRAAKQARDGALTRPIARTKHRKERRLVVEHAPGTSEKNLFVRAAGGGRKSLCLPELNVSGQKRRKRRAKRAVRRVVCLSLPT